MGMFPANLHKNLHELEREISMLEMQSQTIDLSKRKKKLKTLQDRKIQNDKPPDTYGKSVLERKILKNGTEGNKGNKNLPPALSSRLYSTSSGSSICNKKLNKISENCNSNKICKSEDADIKSCSCLCRSGSTKSVPSSNSKRSKIVRCTLENENSAEPNVKSNNLANIPCDIKGDCITHKEVVFTNPEGSIEVTVKQKCNIKNSKKDDIYCVLPVKNTFETESCHCQSNAHRKLNSEPKWSEILSLENIKPSTEGKSWNETLRNSGNSSSNNNMCGRNLQKGMETEVLNSNHVFNENCFQQSKQNQQGQEQKKLLTALSMSANKYYGPEFDHQNSLDRYYMSHIASKSQNDVFETIKKLCDNLIHEKDLLTQEVAAKNSIISSMKKREEEFKSLITTLESNLNRAKDNSKANIDIISELKTSKMKILELTKFIEGLKRNNMQLNEALNKCMLENDRLKTEIQIYKLECQKHDVLIAGKEVEIKRYKEEIGNFQKQISEHLAALKSNSQAVDTKKVMEAIIEQSQVFVHDDSEMGFPSNDHQNKLMHSSPTSTKTSAVNSSWKQISSIKTQEAQSNCDDIENKEFYQVYGGDMSILSSKSSTNKPSGKLLQEDPIVFTSCTSFKNNESLENLDGQRGNASRTVKPSPEKFKSEIDKLLSGLKLKFSEEIHAHDKIDNGTLNDFLNGFLVSSICE